MNAAAPSARPVRPTGPTTYPDPHAAHLQPQQQHQQQQPHGQHGQPASPGGADGPPEPPKAFPELEAMSLKDLRVLHEEKAKFESFVEKHKYQKVVDDFVAKVRADVDTFQREHEAITAKMHQVVDEEAFLKLQRQIEEMEEEVKGLQKLKDEWLEHNSPERLMERLRIAIAEEESVSEGLEGSMLSSSMNFDEFLAQYITCRKKYHERALKLDQLKKETRKRSIGR